MTRNVPWLKIGWTRMDKITFPFKTGPVLSWFFLSIPILNGLPYRSKPVQGFSHSIFHRFFPCLQPILPVTPVQNRPKAKLHYFFQIFNNFLSKPMQRCSTTLFSYQGVCFFLSSICQVYQSTLIKRVWTDKTGVNGAATFLNYHQLNSVVRVYFGGNANTKYFKLCNT